MCLSGMGGGRGDAGAHTLGDPVHTERSLKRWSETEREELGPQGLGSLIKSQSTPLLHWSYQFYSQV